MWGGWYGVGPVAERHDSDEAFIMKVPCSWAQCHLQLSHWMWPNTPRGVQWVTVPDGYVGKAYCSFTCALLAGAMSIRQEKGEGDG